MSEKRGSFSGKLGFVLAAAGSAVGLGNIWRFPYLAARYGGGIFLLVYLVLAVTFGFALMTMEIAIGRKTDDNFKQCCICNFIFANESDFVVFVYTEGNVVQDLNAVDGLGDAFYDQNVLTRFSVHVEANEWITSGGSWHFFYGQLV